MAHPVLRFSFPQFNIMSNDVNNYRKQLGQLSLRYLLGQGELVVAPLTSPESGI